MEPQARRVAVAVRLRPTLGSELGQEKTWQVDGDRGAVSEVRSGDVWAFDHTFGPDVDNAGVFEACCLDVVRSFCSGFNGTVLTYGQTAAGKTHTMQGLDGVIPRAIEEVFAAISHSNGRQFLLTASFLEIYNEQVSDLLTGEDVSVLEGRAGGQVLQRLSSVAVSCPEDVLECVAMGERRRRVGETSANRRSSRSHALLLLGLESRAEGEGNVRYSQLSLGDLAGSEGLRHVELGSREQRREGSCINKSLLALTQVVHALSENGSSRGQRVGFRDSKLTRILQPSLGGNAQTVIICALAPGPKNRAETRSTLDFASRARRVENRVSVNIRRDGHQDSHIRALERQLMELKDRVAALHPAPPQDEARAQELSEENAALKRKIERLQAAFLGDSSPMNLIASVPTPVNVRRRRTIACSGEKERLAASPPLMLHELTIRVPDATPHGTAGGTLGMTPVASEPAIGLGCSHRRPRPSAIEGSATPANSEGLRGVVAGTTPQRASTLKQPGWCSQRPYRCSDQTPTKKPLELQPLVLAFSPMGSANDAQAHFGFSPTAANSPTLSLLPLSPVASPVVAKVESLPEPFAEPVVESEAVEIFQAIEKRAVQAEAAAAHLSAEVSRLQEELKEARQHHSRTIEYLTDELVEVRSACRASVCRASEVMSLWLAAPCTEMLLRLAFAHWQLVLAEARTRKAVDGRNEVLARLERCACGEREVWEARHGPLSRHGFPASSSDEERTHKQAHFPAGAGALGTLLAQSAAGQGS